MAGQAGRSLLTRQWAEIAFLQLMWRLQRSAKFTSTLMFMTRPLANVEAQATCMRSAVQGLAPKRPHTLQGGAVRLVLVASMGHDRPGRAVSAGSRHMHRIRQRLGHKVLQPGL